MRSAERSRVKAGMTAIEQHAPATQMAARASRATFPNGAYVNLGIGLPTLVANYLPQDREIILHTENGLLGMGPAPAPGEEDPDLDQRRQAAGHRAARRRRSSTTPTRSP